MAPDRSPVPLPLGRRAGQVTGGVLVGVVALRPFYDALLFPGAHEWFVAAALILGGLATATLLLGCGAPVPRLATGAMATWVAWAAVSTAWSVDRGVTVRQSFELAALVAVWWAAVQVAGDPRWRRAGVVALAVGLAGAAGRALYQYFYLFQQVRWETFREMTEWIGPVAADRLYSNRVYAWFVSPTVFGDYLAVVIPLAVGGMLGRRYAPRRGRPLAVSLASVVLAGLGLWTLILTTARGAWLATAGALLVLIGWQAARWVLQARGAAAVLALGCALALGAPTRAQDEAPPSAPERVDFVAGMDERYFRGALPSIEDLLSTRTLAMRATYWRGTAGMIRDRPLTGFGWGTWGAAYPRYTVRGGWPTQLAHNNYLQVLAELGPVGFVCFVVVVASAFWGGVRHARLAPSRSAQWTWAGAACSAVAFALHSLTDYALYAPSVAWIAFVLFGVLHGTPSGTPAPTGAPRRLLALATILATLGVLALWLRVADGARSVREARALLGDGQTGAALDAALAAQARLPWDGEAAALAGELMTRTAREGHGPGLAAGVAALARAVRQQPLSPWARASYADALWEQGIVQRDRRLLEAALRERRAAVANFPVRPELHARLADTARALGEEALAAREAALAEELRPSYRSATERN